VKVKINVKLHQGLLALRPVTNAVSYIWSFTTATGWTIYSNNNGLPQQIYLMQLQHPDLLVSATNGCGTITNFSYHSGADFTYSATISEVLRCTLGQQLSCYGTNPQAYNVNVTYISMEEQIHCLVGANKVNITISTATTGNFVYNLVNVPSSSTNCSTNLTGRCNRNSWNWLNGNQISKWWLNSWIGYVYPGAKSRK
jgi:hypothetical protein